ncbi:MAG: hypothetical protein IPL46_17520 [Saprospiraceae bacterium]|nr:hypothetical protein [Saprospiraceae bacterium]
MGGTWEDLNLYRSEYGFIPLESLLQKCECLAGGSTVISVFEDHQGFIWFGRIDNGGLVVIDPKTLSNNCFRTENGLPDNSITSIMQDQEKNLWVGTYRGAAKIKYMDDPLSKSSLEVELIGRADGLSNITLWNGAASNSKQEIYFGTRDGLIELNPENLTTVHMAPQIILSEFNVLNSAPLPKNTPLTIPHPSEKIILNPYQKVFHIAFSGSDFYQSGSMSYAYRFSNLDSSWIDIANQHNLTFANLSPGVYDFEVRARLTNSSWGQSHRIKIQIIPPVYRRWWFATFLILSALALVYAIQQNRILQLKKVQQIREQISHDLHDDIGSALTNIEIMSGLATRTTSPKPGIYQQILETAKNSNESLHQIVWNLNPANDQLKNILPYLSGYAARSLESVDVALEIQDAGVRDELKMDLLRRKDLYLCFKEAITNIIKHSKATDVLIVFDLNHKILKIMISDNGIGIKSNSPMKGNGFINMKKRLEKWGGEARISQGSDQGLDLTLTMPIP